MDKLNKTFVDGDTLSASDLNPMSQKVDEIVQHINDNPADSNPIASITSDSDKLIVKGKDGNPLFYVEPASDTQAGVMSASDKQKLDVMESRVQSAETSASNAEESAEQAQQRLADLEEAMQNLPDGQAVSAQVAKNTTKLSELENRTSEIDTEDADADTEDGVNFYNNDGTELLHHIGDDCANFTNLKSNGNDVFEKAEGMDIESEGEEEGNDDYIMMGSESDDPTVIVYPDRVVVRRIEDMQGNLIGGGGGGRKVICLGDSLTAGVGGAHPFSYYLQEMMPKAEFVNLGVGGHTTNDIMAVQGSQSIIVNNITLPKAGTNVLIGSSVTMSNGSTSTSFIDQRDVFNPAVLDGHEVVVTKSSGNYYVKLKNAEDNDVVIDRPTPITSKNSSKYVGCPVILWMGQNGGYDKWNISYTQVERWIRQCRLVADYSKTPKFIIIGRTSLSASQDSANEEKFEYEFGVNYLNLRKYLVEYGLADAGITPTSADTEAISQGKVPPSLLSDSVHFTTAGYQSISKAIMRKINEINMFN